MRDRVYARVPFVPSLEPLALPKLVLNPEVTDLFDFTFDDIAIEGYESHPHIKAQVAV